MTTPNKMKMFTAIVAICILSISHAFAQKYKTLADTVKLNAEYKKVNTEITDLNNQLTEAKAKLPDY
ncbi:hypothetical protein HH214_00990 [Mucilaginibacter robiniae]|uniref:OmpH family outer membrane protein n=1 Tax=Mucilaginibacter robiniae TaxID=2728022 RepID=A0A7L5DWT7_9SPHI|nr:hypothetical protein [Mucilaginibacter robiniae]QJD94547.1 hypothetical protein HH214_00990 [Mucilaginibacter robiniae]